MTALMVRWWWQAAAMDRLDALRAKYARAQEHSIAFSDALDRWLASMPYGIRGRSDPSGWFVIGWSPGSSRRWSCR
jgi:hypothetical protein